MLVTSASRERSGRAEKVAVAGWPTWTLAMSSSFTCTVTLIWERSPIMIRAPEEPVEAAPAPPEPAWAPSTAFMTTTEPEAGARTVRLSALATASS